MPFASVTLAHLLCSREAVRVCCAQQGLLLIPRLACAVPGCSRCCGNGYVPRQRIRAATLAWKEAPPSGCAEGVLRVA